MMEGLRSDAVSESDIDGLTRLPRSDLLARWQALYGSAPPKGISRRLLIHAIAYRIQEQLYGSLNPATARQLARCVGNEPGGRKKIPQPPSRLRPGTRLVREWNGSTYEVEVVEGGFIWNGERHRSLSAIARTITGARWSGPRFFGLTSGNTS